MCLVMEKDPLFAEKLVAREDMVVYKVGTIRGNGSEFMTCFEEYIYQKDELQPQVRLAPEPGGLWAENKGFRSRVVRGYHSVPDVEACGLLYSGVDIGVFIIPAGTAYYEGVWGDDYSIPNYVSETIIYKGPHGEV